MPNSSPCIFEEHLSKAGRTARIITATDWSNPSEPRRVCDSTPFSILVPILPCRENSGLSLTKRIEGILSGQQSLFDIDRDIEQLAQSCASRIIASYQDVEHVDDSDFREVDLDSLEMSRPRSVGAEHITLEALRLLDLDAKFKELGFNGPQTAAAIGTIIGRCCQPGSELATHTWLQERSGLGELIDYDFNNLSLYGLYQVSDQLLKKKAAIEEHLYAREHSLFGLQETITLYDLTNTYFEGQSKANAFAANGHSKEKRSDCPLVTLGLVLDSSGFPRRSHVYKGNVSEPTTLAEMLQDLEGGHVFNRTQTDGGHGCRHCHRGQYRLVAGKSIPLPGSEQEETP